MGWERTLLGVMKNVFAFPIVTDVHHDILSILVVKRIYGFSHHVESWQIVVAGARNNDSHTVVQPNATGMLLPLSLLLANPKLRCEDPHLSHYQQKFVTMNREGVKGI
jgi:hypothetical protein